MNEIKVPAPHLDQFCATCVEKLGVPTQNARLIAPNLLFANLRGVDSHGLIRLKIYAERLKAGGFKLNEQPQIVSEQDSTGLIDARDGIGQVAATMAMTLAIAKAEKTGM